MPVFDHALMSTILLLNIYLDAGRVRVEPKTFFANERTFIQWLSVGMLLMSVGIAIVEVIQS